MRLRYLSEEVNDVGGNKNGDITARRNTKQRLLRHLVVLRKHHIALLGILLLALLYITLFCSFPPIEKHALEDEEIGSTIFSESKWRLESVFQQPTYYPWNIYAASPNEQWNFQSLWTIAHNPDPTLVGTPLYCVRNGRLYGWKRQHENVRQHLYYDLRVQRYEQLIARSLTLARYAVANGYREKIDARVVELVTETFPFLFEWTDFVTCLEKSFLNGSPFFAFLTFPNQAPDETCMPLATPTYEQWRKHQNIESSSHWDSVFRQQEDENPWNTKINKIVWRGGTTGEKWMYPNWRDLPRAKLVQYAVENPNTMDAGFTSFNNCNDTEIREITDAGLAGKHMEMKDYQKYRSIIDIDGNSWSSRFADLLCMNSVVIKVEPRWIDYFYPELQPWVHYVPVHANLSNLVEIATMVTSEDKDIKETMRQIVQNANNWCRSKMTSTQLSIDMLWLLISYFQMLTKEDTRSGDFTRWKEVQWSAHDWIEIPFNHSAS